MNKKVWIFIALLVGIFLVGFTLAVQGEFAHVEAQCRSGALIESRNGVQFLGSDCRLRAYVDDGGATSTPMPTGRPTGTDVSPTNTSVVTETEPTATPVEPTSTIMPTEEPTVEPTSTSPPPSGHNTSVCHHAQDGHTHGMCFDDLPSGMIKSWIADNMWVYDIDNVVKSSPSENLYPYPVGKHVGFKFLYTEFPTCQQYSGGVNMPGNGCIKAIWVRIHSLGTAEAMRTPGNTHSFMMIAEVCDAGFNTCDVVQIAENEFYGEIHAIYKKEGCYNVPGGIEYAPKYSINHGAGAQAQPPYVATRTSLFDQAFWSSLTNQGLLGIDVNNLLNVAWMERMFENPNTDPNLCADPAQDLLHFTSTNEGFLNQYAFETIDINIDGYPRPFDGFTDPDGHPAPGCSAPSSSCYPIHIGSNVPAVDSYYNVVVRNIGQSGAQHTVIDITEPNVFMPGMAP